MVDVRVLLVATVAVLAGGLAVLAPDGRADTQTKAVTNSYAAAGAAVMPDTAGRYDLGALGYRPEKVSGGKSPGTYRILSIGDSYVYGITRPEFTVSALLERELDAAGTNGDVEVINLGVPGVGFPEYMAIYNFWSGRIAHDAVIFAIHAGTDWIDLRFSPPYRALGDALVREPGNLVAPGVINALSSGGASTWSFAPPPSADERYESQVQFDDDSYLRVMRAWGSTYMLDRLAELADGYAWARRFLLFADEIARRGTKVLLVVTPSPLAASANWRQRVIAAEGLKVVDLDPGLPGALLKRLAVRDGRQISLMDLTNCLADQDRPSTPVFYGTNVHWSVEGSQVVANTLSAFVEAHWFDRTDPPAAPPACQAGALEPTATEAHERFLDQLD
jgi:hypothetical protein